MTRKDYTLLANVFLRTRPAIVEGDTAKYVVWRGIVREMAEQLKLDNAKFKLDVFEKACGVR